MGEECIANNIVCGKGFGNSLDAVARAANMDGEFFNDFNRLFWRSTPSRLDSSR